jgi:transposase-like protein
MRPREKLTVEEKVAIALELIKRERTLDEIQEHYRVSHTTAYKLRNLFLEGGRQALARGGPGGVSLEARVRALEERVERQGGRAVAAGERTNGRARANGAPEM